jgi:hypothetical protein
MEDKIIISSVLADLTLASKTKFIEAKGNEDLIKLAKSKGIDLPSPDLACFETYYCELDKPNLNNAMLTKKAAEEGINSLIGKQINLNHLGKNYICGYTIDAKIKDNLIVVTGILFKSLFPEEFDEIKQLFEEGKLFVSFELWNREPESGKSIIEIMENGVKKITKMIAHGVGLLLTGVKPACKKAQVFKLLANQKDNGERIFQEDDRFAYASFSNEVMECTHCGFCTKDKEGTKVEEIYLLELATDNVIELKEGEITSFENEYEGTEIEEAKRLTYEQKKNLPDDDYAVVITVKNKVTGEPRKIRMFVISDPAHVRNALARLGQSAVQETLKKLGVSVETVKNKILKRAKELNMKDLLDRYSKAEEEYEGGEIEESKKLTYQEVQNLPDSDFALIQEKDGKKVRRFPIPDEAHVRNALARLPQAKDISEEEKKSALAKILKKAKELNMTELLKKYEKAEEAQATPEPAQVADPAPVVEQKPDEQAQVAEQPVETKPEAVKEEIVEVKFTQADVDAKLAEKEIEITNLKKELDSKNQEIAELKTPKVEVAKVEEKPELDVGTVEKNKEDRYKKLHDEVNERAFGKKKDKK